tara:strand:- start:3097 stop:4344 length:1248 start_codon:yes stop_codon:yes gene_type:complete
MASTYTPLGVELQATGENAGTWGTKTNTNLQILEQISGGFTQQSIAGGAQTTTLSVSDGSTGAVLSHRMIEFTGTITGNQIVTIPLDVQTFYFLRNSTSGAYTVQFKYVSGSGDSFTFASTDKGDQLIFAAANDSTNPDIITLAFGDGDVTTTGTQTLTNKTLTAPKIADGGFIADANGAEQIIFQTTSSAVNELEVTNAATGNPPILGASGETNVDVHIKPKGSGETRIGTGAAAATLTTSGAHDLVLDTNSGSNSGSITITDGANGDISVTPNGIGRVSLGAGAIQQLTEKITVSATAATGTINYDVITQAVLYFTSAASGNFTVNFRGDGSNTLNSIMDTGESLTTAFLVTNTGTPYYNNAVTIDGSSITPEWQGGSAPSAGNANSIDVYTYTIIKTADATFTALAAQTQFA